MKEEHRSEERVEQLPSWLTLLLVLIGAVLLTVFLLDRVSEKHPGSNYATVHEYAIERGSVLGLNLSVVEADNQFLKENEVMYLYFNLESNGDYSIITVIITHPRNYKTYKGDRYYFIDDMDWRAL